MPRCAHGCPIRNAVARRVWSPAKSGIGLTSVTLSRRCRHAGFNERKRTMEYGIGGILILILVILAIVYFAKRV